MKVVKKSNAKCKATVKYRQRDSYGNPIYKSKTLYFDDLPLHNLWIGSIDSDAIRKTAIEIVRNQQSNIESFVPIYVRLAIKNKFDEFISAI